MTPTLAYLLVNQTYVKMYVLYISIFCYNQSNVNGKPCQTIVTQHHWSHAVDKDTGTYIKKSCICWNVWLINCDMESMLVVSAFDFGVNWWLYWFPLPHLCLMTSASKGLHHWGNKWDASRKASTQMWGSFLSFPILSAWVWIAAAPLMTNCDI